jgi:hypothetical protein
VALSKMTIKQNKFTLFSWLQSAGILVAIVLGVVGMLRNCSQDEKIEDLSFQNSSLQHRPHLKVIRNPEIIGIRMIGSKKFAIKDLIKSKSEIDSIKTLEIPADMTLKFKLTIKNIGNALAKVYLIGMMDTTTGEDRMRDILKTMKPDSSDSSYFHNLEISSGDSTIFENEWKIQFFSNNSFTIHFFLVYGNDFNAIYDTYYWVRYQAAPIESLYKLEESNGKIIYRKVQEQPNPSEVLKVIETNSSSKAYSKKESEEIIQHFDSMVSTVKKPK